MDETLISGADTEKCDPIAKVTVNELAPTSICSMVVDAVPTTVTVALLTENVLFVTPSCTSFDAASASPGARRTAVASALLKIFFMVLLN